MQVQQDESGGEAALGLGTTVPLLLYNKNWDRKTTRQPEGQQHLLLLDMCLCIDCHLMRLLRRRPVVIAVIFLL